MIILKIIEVNWYRVNIELNKLNSNEYEQK